MHVLKLDDRPLPAAARPGLSLILAALAAALFWSLLSAGPAQALTKFPGGDCTLVAQANGIRLDFCTNTTEKTVDDIHVTFSHPGLPNRLVDYRQSLNCDLFGIGDCFGPAVAPGANWEGILGGTGEVANVTLWTANDLIGVDFDFKRVKATGFWTRSGAQVVPEPGVWSLMIAGFGLAGLALRARRRPFAITS